MKIDPQKPKTPFNFGHAVGAMFATGEGKAFAWRLLFWTAACISVVTLITVPFLLPHYGALLENNAETMRAIMSGQEPPEPDLDVLMPIYMKLLPVSLVMMLGFWIAYAMGEAALHRKLLLGQEHSKRPIGFGKDELRVMLAQLGVWAMFFAVYIGLVVMTSIGLVIPIIGIIIGIIGFIAILSSLIYVPVKLGSASRTRFS